jgi:hypothetical protein
MATKLGNKTAREELRKKLQARKDERKTANTVKYARLRQVAAEEAKNVDEALTELAEFIGGLATAFTNLKDHLGLITAPKTAALPVRLAAARKYAASFKRIAEETPEVIADALNEVYQSLDEVGHGIENLAQNMGIDLNLEESEEGLEVEGEEFANNVSEEKESSDEPEEAPEMGDDEPKEASGSDSFVTDRDAQGKPQKPEHMEIPEAQGKAAKKKKN